MEVNELDLVEAQEEIDKATKVGKWKQIIEEVIKENKAVEIKGITRGQVAALYRKAKDAGLQVKASYKDQTVILAPAKE